MSTSNNNQTAEIVDSPVPAADKPSTGRARSVHRCDFRLAGMLPNEDARAITASHETLATNLAALLDAMFGIPFDIRFDALKQLSVKDHVAAIPSLCYIVPFSSAMVMAEFDLDLVFPLIELLMGGAGDAKSANRDLSEIEEEMLQDIVLLMVRQAEATWSIPGLTVQPEPRIKPAAVLQTLRPTEKVTVLRFECKFANASGAFTLVLSASLVDLLVKQLKTGREQKKSGMFSFPAPPLRERILDCEVEVAAQLPDLRVSVRDLISLEAGSVLKLRAPVQTPAMLTLAERALFQAVPVRSGPRRAAQLGRSSHSIDCKRR